jgi:cold shock CspA family protein
VNKFKGRIKSLKEGHGYITKGNEDIFFHESYLHDGIYFEELNEGDELEFFVGMGKNGKPVAGQIDRVEALIKSVKDDPSILEDSVKRTELLEEFSKLSLPYKACFIFLLINVFFSQVNSISANLLTPWVESYLSSISMPNSLDTEKIIPLPMKFNNDSKNNFRFITGEYVRLRESQSTESKILGELQLGQVFKVLSQSGNWLEIEYTDNKNNKIYGWVSVRYTAKFVSNN